MHTHEIGTTEDLARHLRSVHGERLRVNPPYSDEELATLHDERHFAADNASTRHTHSHHNSATGI